MCTPRPVAVAVEAIESSFQNALNAYTSRNLSEEDFYFASDWENRWEWP